MPLDKVTMIICNQYAFYYKYAPMCTFNADAQVLFKEINQKNKKRTEQVFKSTPFNNNNEIKRQQRTSLSLFYNLLFIKNI